MKTCIIITGASRGFGRAMAIEFAKVWKCSSHLVLVARNVDDLVATEELARTEMTSECKFSQVVADLGDLETLEASTEKILAELRTDSDWDNAILINNAGSLGPSKPVSMISSLKDLQNAINLNITSTTWLTSQFLSLALSNTNATAENPSVVLNVSSLAAVQAMDTLGVYCIGKSARDMLHSSVALETKDNTDVGTFVKSLNYAPGVLDTAMTASIREDLPELDSGLVDSFRTMKEEGKMMTPGQSAEMCVRLLLKNEFESGSHLDYYDLL